MSYTTGQSLYFASLSALFWAAWAVGCYQTIYLQGRGFTAAHVGTMNALCSCIAIAATSTWGVVADKINSVRKVETILLFGNALLFSLVPFVKYVFPDALWPYFVLLAVCATCRSPLGTFHENLIIRNANELRLNYGAMRSMGSLIFAIVSTVVADKLYDIGVENTFWISGLCWIPVIALTIRAREPGREGNTEEVGGELPEKSPEEVGGDHPERSPEEAADQSTESGKVKKKQRFTSKKQKLNLRPLLKNRAYVMLLVFAVLFYFAVNFEGNFIPFFMQEKGIDSSRYGTLLAIRAVFEMPFLLLMVKLRGRYSLRSLLLFAPLLMGSECLAFALLVRDWTTMMLVAGLFGLGNGLYIGTAMNYVYEIAPEGLKASAQAFFTVSAQVSGILSSLVGGFLFEGMGSQRFYLLTALLFGLSILVFLISGRTGKKGKNSARLV
ncbi:MAG: MFS transporter [Lachnospiraceae bacterium]|nr:MFS transporter [Lachnospiraceae bacterium]